jgi:hypothetical protein
VHSVIQKSNIWPGQSIQIVILICVRMCKKKRGFYPSMTDGEDDKIADWPCGSDTSAVLMSIQRSHLNET